MKQGLSLSRFSRLDSGFSTSIEHRASSTIGPDSQNLFRRHCYPAFLHLNALRNGTNNNVRRESLGVPCVP